MRATFVVLLSMILLSWLGQSSVAETLFYDDYERKELGKNYVTEYVRAVAGSPKWVVEDGVLKQTEPTGMGDSCYAIITDQDYPAVLTIKAKVRIDSWTDGDGARTGVAVRVMLEHDGSGEGDGFTFLFHNNKSTIQFLNDLKSWGVSGTYKFDTGTWYWMQLHIDKDDVLHGKVWEDGKDEPKDWMLEQDTKVGFGNFPRPEGYPALNGGATRGGAITMSFDDVEVWDEGGSTLAEFLSVRPAGKLVNTWAKIKSLSEK